MTRYFPSTEELRAFVAVVERGRLKRAAEDLRVTESAVSHQLRRLETGLGTRLVERGRDRTRLTEAGTRFYAKVSPALASILNATEELAPDVSSKVRLTLPRSLATHWLVQHYTSLYLRHPQIELELLPTSRLCDLSRERIDLGIRYGDPGWPGVEFQHLFEEACFPLASPQVALGWRRGPAHIVEGRRLILNATHPDEWHRWFELEGWPDPTSSTVSVLGDFELVLNAGLSGAGMIMGRRPMVNQLLARGDLVAPFGATAMPGKSYYLIWPKGRPRSRHVAAVSDWVLSTGA